MKIIQHLFLIGLLIVTLLNSCKKDVKPTQVEIKYSLHDDVSPVKVVFTINHKLEHAKWEIDTITKDVFNQDSLEYIFQKEDTASVKLTAEGIHDEEYFGNVDVIIPKVANKLKVYGCYFKDNYNLGIVEDTIIFRLNFYDGTNYHNNSVKVSRNDFENNDSILFKEPIVIDITGFENIDDDSQFMYFIIEGKDNVNSYFKDNFFVRDWYYNYRMYAPNYIYLDNINGNNERIFLDADWTR